MSIRDIAVTMIWFQPLFAWLGLLTFLMLIITASYGYMLFKGRVRSFKTHMWLAAMTIVSGVLHAVLALTILI
ncbi:conserved hypothetical protein [Methanocella paludicola SANAE]|uniref:Uncharacterized protein n=1 Tax=Methanocella paludicola (strain DSM 17711 / JCM 13418 / NBRC 101707 / SANAE) TaxID=304371 RepID=D1Z2J2_METPS|nr:hypothetical protein [Methanocella paludicola]BAI62914.1 conserved hypothetical protein [Methanocella paludicola SANAE]